MQKYIKRLKYLLTITIICGIIYTRSRKKKLIEEEDHHALYQKA